MSATTASVLGMLTAAIVVGACASASVPPPLGTPERGPVAGNGGTSPTAVMRRFSDRIGRLHASVLGPYATHRAQSVVRLQLLDDLLADAAELRRSYDPLLHPTIAGGIDSFLEDLEAARRETERPNDLTVARRAAAACSSCHALGAPDATR